MASGVVVDDKLVKDYDEMKLRSSQAFLVAKIQDSALITQDVDIPIKVCKENDRALNEEVFNYLKGHLQDDQPRYIVFDFRYTTAEGKIVNKLAFIFWCSDNCGIKDKMLYASSKESVRKSYKGLGAEVQANDKGDLDYDEITKSIEKK